MFAAYARKRPRAQLTIRQRMRVLEQWPQNTRSIFDPEAAFTLLLCCTHLQLILFLSIRREVAFLEDGVRRHYFAATPETH